MSYPYTPRPYGSGKYGEGIYQGDSSVIIGGRGASYYFVPRIWRSNINRTQLEDLTPARGVRAQFTTNSDYDTKRQGWLEAWEIDVLRPLEDWIVAEAMIVRDDEVVGIYPLGHYLVIDPDITGDDYGRRGRLELRDLTWLLRNSTLASQYVVPAGTDHGAAIRSIAMEQGIPAALIDIPDSGTVLPSDFVREAGDNWLSVMTDLGSGGALYQPWVNNAMQLTTRKVVDIQNSPADASYRMEDGAKIIPPYQQRPEFSRVRNRVTVRKAVPGQEVISWTATVTNVDSLVHPNRLGERMGLDRPVYLGQTYEEATLESEEQARELAEYRLSLAASFLDRLNIETYLDHTSLEEHQILDVNLTDGGTNHATGNWLQRVSSVEVNGPVVTCRRELTRTISVR